MLQTPVKTRLLSRFCQQRLKTLAPGLTTRSVLEKFESMQMVDVHLPTTDGKELRLPRYTEPSMELVLLLMRLKLNLPPQPKPELLDKRPEFPVAALTL